MPVEEHPVELTAPDITPYKAGNIGVDYVTTMDSGTPNPGNSTHRVQFTPAFLAKMAGRIWATSPSIAPASTTSTRQGAPQRPRQRARSEPTRPPARSTLFTRPLMVQGRHCDAWKDSGKYCLEFAEPAREIGPIKLGQASRGKAPQAPRYTSMSKLTEAKTLSEVF